MRTKFFYTLLFLSSTVQADIVFLDLNNNPLEKKAAIEEAQLRGEKIIVYPQDDTLYDNSKAQQILKQHKPDTLILSGHNGGASISGDRNERLEFDVFESFMNNNPEVKNNISTLMLNGCNTGTQYVSMKYKNLFPNLKFIAGYDGTSPTEKWVQGRHYIKDVIKLKDEINNVVSEEELEDMIGRFRHMDNVLQAGMLFEIPCCVGADPIIEGENKLYIYRPKREREEEKFKSVDFKECPEKIKEYRDKYQKTFKKYDSGKLPIPEDTLRGELKTIHDFITQNEHCFDGLAKDDIPSNYRALFLRFFRDIRNNFAVYYEDYLTEYFSELDHFSTKEKAKSYFKNRQKELARQYAWIKENFYNWGSLSDSKIKDYIKKRIANAASSSERQKWQEQLTNYGSSRFKKNLKIYHRELVAEKEELKKDFKKDLRLALRNYKKMPIKTLEQFKSASRKDIVGFVEQFKRQGTYYSSNKKLYRVMQQLTQELLYELAENVIPFNWHDSTIGYPVDVRETWYMQSSLNSYHKQDKSKLSQDLNKAMNFLVD